MIKREGKHKTIWKAVERMLGGSEVEAGRTRGGSGIGVGRRFELEFWNKAMVVGGLKDRAG